MQPGVGLLLVPSVQAVLDLAMFAMHVPHAFFGQIVKFACFHPLWNGRHHFHSAAQTSERCNVAEGDAEQLFGPKRDYDVINAKLIEKYVCHTTKNALY